MKRITVNMKNLLLLISLIMLISGCSSKQSTAPKKPKKNKFDNSITLNLNKPIDQINIYIDDSLDVKRNEKIVDIVYNSLKNKEIKS